MKPVLKSPATNLGLASSDAWKGMLLETPRMTNALSASRIRRIASFRSLPCTMSLAIIES